LNFLFAAAFPRAHSLAITSSCLRVYSHT
jgi:hypothetical protein